MLRTGTIPGTGLRAQLRADCLITAVMSRARASAAHSQGARSQLVTRDDKGALIFEGCGETHLVGFWGHGQLRL